MHLENVYQKLRVAAMTISGFVISCTAIILLLPLIIALAIYSKIVHFMIKLKHGDKYTRPGGLDILQGVETFRSRPYINAVARYEGHLDVDLFCKRMFHLAYKEKDANGEEKFRRLRQILEPCYGYHIFKDAEDFDVRNHVIKVRMSDLFPEKYAHSNGNGNANGGCLQNGYHPVGLHSVLTEDGENEEGNNIEWERIMQRLLDKFGIKQMSNKIPQWRAYILEEDTK